MEQSAGVGDAMLRRKAAFPPTGLRVEAGDLRAWEEGSVGWLSDTPSFVLPDGTAIRTRTTAVMRREDGDWKLVQAHVSVGVPDEEVIELTSKWSG